MSVLISTTLADALAALGRRADVDGPRRWHRRDGRDQQRASSARGGHRGRPDSRSCAPGRTMPQTLRRCASAPASPTPSWRRSRSCDWVPALSQAARTVGSPQIRHAATLGGNVATCSPAGDGLPVLAALDAIVHLVSADGIALDAVRRVHDRPEAHRVAAGRVDRGRLGSRVRRLAGLRQGRRAQRDGHLQRRRVPRRRRRRRRADRARFGRPDDHPLHRRRGVRRVGRRPRQPIGLPTPTRPSSAVWPPRPRGRSTIIAPPRSTAVMLSPCWPAVCCAGRSRMAETRAATTSARQRRATRSAMPGSARACSMCCVSGSA